MRLSKTSFQFFRAVKYQQCLQSKIDPLFFSQIRVISLSGYYHTNKKKNWYQHSKDFPFKPEFLIFGGLIGVGAAFLAYVRKDLSADAQKSLSNIAEGTEEYGKFIEGLPEYDLEEVAKHSVIESRVWVSFRHGVYDITDFIAEHPGGDKILLGAGGSVEPFWALYAVHKKPDILQLLEKYRIGNLKAEDYGTSVKNMSDPYANEPRRHVALKPVSKEPFNAEPQNALLVEQLLTPNELFYVRNHLPVPVVDSKSYELDIDGLGINETTLSLDDIKKFPKYSINAAIQCGGNRRSEMAKVKPIKGLNWGQGAISNAKWTGARLIDVLKAAGFDEKETKAVHVQFEGLDTDPTGSPYGASIPIEKLLNPRGDVLLAYEMNDELLSRDHGFPIRLVAPGIVGARSVKWLGRIVLSEKESDAHWQQNDYKSFAPNINWNTVDFSKSPAIQETPVTSAICDPSDSEIVKAKNGKITAKGYAYSGGGRKIIRVDISADGGKTWRAVDELVSDDAQHPQAWGWTLWKAEIPVGPNVEEVQIVVKAVDSSHNTQPEKFENIWNLRGVVANAYHRVHIKVKH